ncbi:hypothetical protein VNO77_02056 [Canavalia gladiata]|uniref:Uncharacterized protein n=1 Tax=Canavalia gladiata TaxID=3824 RepID=A0AAN9R5R5_CANGL
MSSALSHIAHVHFVKPYAINKPILEAIASTLSSPDEECVFQSFFPSASPTHALIYHRWCHMKYERMPRVLNNCLCYFKQQFACTLWSENGIGGVYGDEKQEGDEEKDIDFSLTVLLTTPIEISC